jgi:hypothetical protein
MATLIMKKADRAETGAVRTYSNIDAENFRAVRSKDAYSISMAWVGQESTQAPQSAHNSPSITALLSFSSIAPHGHVSMQSPHPSHVSNLTIAAIHESPDS